jgi:hypothetical protein
MTRPVDAAIAAIARRQSCVFSRRQYLEVGGTDDQIASRLATRAWLLRHPGVYGVAASPDSYAARLWSAVLAVGTGAVVSHQAAAALRGIPGYPTLPCVLSVPHGAHARVLGVTIHQPRDFATTDHTTHPPSGLPVTTVVRTVVDLAAVVSGPKLRHTVAEVLSMRLAAWDELGAGLAAVARPGKPGVRKLAAALDEVGPGRIPPRSRLERLLCAALASGGLPRPVLQHPFPGRMDVEGCVDGAYPDVRLILEADGRRWHTRIRDLRRDHERDAQAARAGWQTLRFLHEHLTGDPAGVCATVRDTRRVRTRRPA